MSDNWANIGISLVILTIIGMLVGGTLYGCQRAGDQYYDLANKCIQAGGAWVPDNRGSYAGLCINTRASR